MDDAPHVVHIVQSSFIIGGRKCKSIANCQQVVKNGHSEGNQVYVLCLFVVVTGYFTESTNCPNFQVPDVVGFLCIPFLGIQGNIPVSIPEWTYSVTDSCHLHHVLQAGAIGKLDQLPWLNEMDFHSSMAPVSFQVPATREWNFFHSVIQDWKVMPRGHSQTVVYS